MSGKLNLPSRAEKPRETGLTAVTDTGLCINALSDVLDSYGQYLDIAKFGVGSAYVEPQLDKKIALYKSHNVTPYIGGTLFEKFYFQNKLSDYLDLLKSWQINAVEISCGVIDIPLDERLKLVEQLKKEFIVLAEVGCKDSDAFMPPKVWVSEMKALLAAGCDYVITEGRDSGTAGIYTSQGAVRSDLINDIKEELDASRIIFEAPAPKMQMYFINLFGSNVNLGNVALKDLLLLEAQRLGLRYETFHAV